MLTAAAAVYTALYSVPAPDLAGSDDSQCVPATFNFVNMIGWKHHESQPKPKPRGSGTAKLGDVPPAA